LAFPGVVDEDVEIAKPGNRLRDETFRRRGIREVRLEDLNPATMLANTFRHLLRAALVRVVVDRNVRPFAGECQRRRPPDSTIRARDESDVPFETHAVLLRSASVLNKHEGSRVAGCLSQTIGPGIPDQPWFPPLASASRVSSGMLSSSHVAIACSSARMPSSRVAIPESPSSFAATMSDW